MYRAHVLEPMHGFWHHRNLGMLHGKCRCGRAAASLGVGLHTKQFWGSYLDRALVMYISIRRSRNGVEMHRAT